ncbi:MAG: radical SAM protein, partial [Kiritimatiellae bacterium]|nr:radical SAM protein [Kiritimatiellia bacterium]
MKFEEEKDHSFFTEIKADMLCLGLRPDSTTGAILSRQNPCHDHKTGNFGIHIRFPNGSHALVTVTHRFDRLSPYALVHDNELVLLKDETPICEVEEVPMPFWYGACTDSGSPMPRIFLHEGSHFLHQAYSGCDYQKEGNGCQFCSAGTTWRIGTPEEVAQVTQAALTENRSVHVCLGGGSRLPQSRNVEYFSACAERIRAFDENVPIWVETTPPERAGIKQLIDSGVTAFGFNIEIWDPAIRCKICPGKSAISRNEYLQRMQYAISLLGPNRLGSCLIAGLEPAESTIEGICEMTRVGVQPCILPFRPWDKSLCQNARPCSQSELLYLSEEAVNAMRENRINPNRNQGCLLCDGCTIDHDI